MQPTTLIQLVGDQTVQNLLPVMALRPDKIIQLRSRDLPHQTRFKVAAANFSSAVKELAHEDASKGYKPEVITEEIPDTSPDIETTRILIAQKLAAIPGSVVNFTGATKLMSIGAHQAASALGAPSIYCDTQEKRFTDGGTGKLDAWPDFSSTASALTVPLLMAAHGKNFGEWRHDIPTDALKAYGLVAFGQRRTHWEALEGFNKALRSFFYRKNGKIPSSEAELRKLISEPLPNAVSSTQPGRELLEAATNANILLRQGSDHFIIANGVKRDVERVANLLIGTWLELAVLAMLERHPRYQNPLWSVSPRKTHDTDFGEMDLVCVDQRTASLRYLSCKAVLDRPPLEHLEAVGDRAHRVGGSHAASTLVVFHPFDQGQEQIIARYAMRLRMDAAIGADKIVGEFHHAQPAATPNP